VLQQPTSWSRMYRLKPPAHSRGYARCLVLQYSALCRLRDCAQSQKNDLRLIRLSCDGGPHS